MLKSDRGYLNGGETVPVSQPWHRLCALNRGCDLNPDLDFENLHPDFPIEREIRKRISPPRNPSSGWISIKKSKSGLFGFPFYRSIRKSELFSWTAVFVLLIMRPRARPLFLRTVFQILLMISQSNSKNENPKTDISALKSVFGFRVRLEIRNPDFENLNPDFPIERTLEWYLTSG